MASTNTLCSSRIHCYNPDPKPPPPSFNDLVTIRVIEADGLWTDYLLYRSVLRFYFQHLFKKGNAKANLYRLENPIRGKFDMFHSWVTTGDAFVGEQDASVTGKREQAVKLHQFAEYWAIPALENYAIDMFYRCCLTSGRIDPADIRAVYNHSKKYSKLKILVLDLMLENHIFKDCEDDLPEEFLVDIIGESRHRKNAIRGQQDSFDYLAGFWKLGNETRFCEYYHTHYTLA